MTDTDTSRAAGEPPRPLPLRHAFAVFIGNGLEFYDFVTYAFFAVYIGRTFFPSEDPSLSLLGSLGLTIRISISSPLGRVTVCVSLACATRGNRMSRLIAE